MLNVKTILISLILVFLTAHFNYAQSVRETYNEVQERYEYYEDYDLIGYKKRDVITGEWIYTEISNKRSSNSHKSPYRDLEPSPTFDANTVYEVLAAKEARYDYNVNQLRNLIEDLGSKLESIEENETRVIALKQFSDGLSKFNKNSGKIDFSSSKNTQNVANHFVDIYNEIVEWSYQNMANINENYLHSSNKSKKTNPWSNIIGGFKTNNYSQYRLNSLDKYEFRKSVSIYYMYFYFSNEYYYMNKDDGNGWIKYGWSFVKYEYIEGRKYYIFKVKESNNRIAIDTELKQIFLFENDDRIKYGDMSRNNNLNPEN